MRDKTALHCLVAVVVTCAYGCGEGLELELNDELDPLQASGPVKLEAEDDALWSRSTGRRWAGPPAGWDLYANGSITTRQTYELAAGSSVTVVASGTAAARIWPEMRLSLGDGDNFHQVGRVWVSPDGWSEHSFPLDAAAAGRKRLRVSFHNDAIIKGEDRNLRVDEVRFARPAQEEQQGDRCTPGTIVRTAGSRSVCKAACPAVGVNILSKGNEYKEAEYSESRWPALMAYLASHGQSWIALRVIWERMQPEGRTDFNAALITRMVRLIKSAEAAGLRVMLDFHTLMHRPHFCPPWLCEQSRCRCLDADCDRTVSTRCMGHYLSAIESSYGRDAYLNLLKGVISRLKGANGGQLPRGIGVISLINEPWQYGDWSEPGHRALVANRGRLERLIVSAAQVVRKLAPNVPLGVRFTLKNNPWAADPTNRFAATVLAGLDFVGFNNYEPASAYRNEKWAVFERAMTDARQRGLGVWVTEYGKNTGSLAQKEAYFASVLRDRFSAQLRPDVTLAWGWQSSAPEGQGYNVAKELARPPRSGPFAALAAHGAACLKRIGLR